MVEGINDSKDVGDVESFAEPHRIGDVSWPIVMNGIFWGACDLVRSTCLRI